MAGSVNKVILVGNLGKDPEVRRTQDGRPVCNLRVATTDSWRDKNSASARNGTPSSFSTRDCAGWPSSI